MKFAVNYSTQGAQLWKQGLIEVDLFKCPAWVDLISELHITTPIYIHFPLRVGKGIGDAINTETKEPPQWQIVESLLTQTKTQFINVHLAPIPEDHPYIPIFDLGTAYSERFSEYMIKDINPLVSRYGADTIICENIYSFWGEHPKAAIVPEVVRDVIVETGCGLLLDISHARQAARELGMDPKVYIEQLPVDRLREIHITGIQVFSKNWGEKLEAAGIKYEAYAKYMNHCLDHLPMTEADWEFLDWSLEQIKRGQWRTPELVTFEYSGVGKGFFQATTDVNILQSQIPRMYNMVHQSSSINQL